MISPETWCALHALNAEYWRRVDRQSDAAVDDLYTDDGRMHIGTLKCEGKQQIRSFFIERSSKEREAQRTTRHSASFLSIEEIGSSRWCIQSTVQVMAGVGDWPMTSAAPSTVGDFEDTVVRTADGRFLYESRTARIVFVGGGAAAFAR